MSQPPAPIHPSWRTPALRRTLALGLPLLFGLHLLLGWTRALPLVDAWIWLLQIADAPALAQNTSPGLAWSGVHQPTFLQQLGVFHAATGRAFAVYIAWGQWVAHVAGLNAVLWKAANLTLVFATFGLLADALRRLGYSAWFTVACLALLLAPLADRPGYDACAYLTSAEVPAAFLVALATWASVFPGLASGALIGVALAAAALCKESSAAFIPAVLLLRYRTERRVWPALWPLLLVLGLVAPLHLWIRAHYPLAGQAYTAVAGSMARAPVLQGLRRALLAIANQLWLPPRDPGIAHAFPLAIGLRGAWTLALVRVAWLAGLRPQARAWWRASSLQVVTALAWLAGGLATVLVYWAMGRDVYGDFHVALGALGLVVGLALAAEAVHRPAPIASPRRLRVAVLVAALLTAAVASTTSLSALWGALAVLLVLALALRPATPARIAVAVALLLFVPRLTELARERALGVHEPESLQAALDKVTALPPNAIVHVDVRRPGNVETAFALRAYMLLRGRLDLRTCVSAGPTALLAVVTPYVAHQTALARADEPPRPHPLPQLDLVLTPEPVPSEAFAVPFFWSFAEPPLTRVDVRPGTACDTSAVR